MVASNHIWGRQSRSRYKSCPTIFTNYIKGKRCGQRGPPRIHRLPEGAGDGHKDDRELLLTSSPAFMSTWSMRGTRAQIPLSQCGSGTSGATKIITMARPANLTVFFDDECAFPLRRWLKIREGINVKHSPALFLGAGGERQSVRSL